MKKIVFTLLGLGCFALASAQTKTATVVDSQTKTPIVGASIEIKGEGNKVTDSNGTFSFTCKDTVDIRINQIGYTSFRKKQACKGNMTFELTSESLNLNLIEITAKSDPHKTQLDIPSSIVALSATEIKRGTGLFLDDAINGNVPGVTMQRRTTSAGQQFNIRGYGNGMGVRGVNSNFDSQGAKVYLNGIAITDAEGITVLDDIDFGSVSNVEIAKGPSGTLYGLAIAGAVNMQTQKAAKNTLSIGQDYMAGSYGLMRATTRVAIGGDRTSYLINYGKQHSDGFMQHTASDKEFVNVIAESNVSEKQTFTSYVGYANSYDERNGELTQAQYDNLDYSGNTAYIKNNAHSAVRTLRAGVGHTYKFNSHISNTTSAFGSGQAMDASSAGGWTDKNPINYGLRSTFNTQFQLGKNINLTGITGMEMQRMNAITIGYNMGADSTNLGGIYNYNVITTIKSNQATTNSTYNYFTQWTAALPKGFALTAGVGVSNMSIHLEDRLWGVPSSTGSTNNHPGNTKSKTYDASYTNLVSPSVALNKKINDVASAYVSYSVGYKAPVASNVLISTTGQVNTGLKPEKGSQLEIGTKGSLLDGKLFYTVAAFSARFENKFTTIAVPNPSNTATLYTYLTNGGSMINKGVEVLVKYTAIKSNTGFIKHLSPFINATFCNYRYDNFGYTVTGNNNTTQTTYDYSGHLVAGVAPLTYNLGFDLETKMGFYANANYNYRGRMYYTSDLQNTTNAFALLNAKLGYRKSFKALDVDIYAGANNMLSAQYYTMVFVNQAPDAFVPGPNEINYFGGVNLRYNF
jgi:iron complex outermembrane recepter protein